MTIYIPEFWVGVLFTVTLEIAIILAIGFYNTFKNNKRR